MIQEILYLYTASNAMNIKEVDTFFPEKGGFATTF